MKGRAYFNKFICVIFYFLIFQLHCVACGISVPWPGIKLAVLPYISSAVLTTVYHGGGGPGSPQGRSCDYYICLDILMNDILHFCD